MVKEILLGSLLTLGGVSTSAYQLHEIHTLEDDNAKLRDQIKKDEAYLRQIGQIAAEDRSLLQPLRVSSSLRQCIIEGLQNPDPIQWMNDVLGKCQSKEPDQVGGK